MKYTVGQILYLIGENSMRILPIQIVEEVVTTTVDGSSKSYTALLPDAEETRISMNDIKGQIFESRHSVREHMVKNATKAIDDMVESATVLSTKKFKPATETIFKLKSHDEESVKEKPSVVQDTSDNGIIKVDLGDGNFANMSSASLQKIGG